MPVGWLFVALSATVFSLNTGPRAASITRSMSRFFRIAPYLALFCLANWSAGAHPADESALRVRVAPHQLEFRMTFNIFTLTRFTKVDANGDGKIGISELDAAQPHVAFYLNKHVGLLINKQRVFLGADVEFEYLWPDARSSPPMTEAEYSSRNVDVTFVLPGNDRLPETLWMQFDVFEQTGPTQIIKAAFEQEGFITEVEFHARKPEYQYDTGFAKNPSVQEAEKQPAAAKSQTQAPDSNTPDNNSRWWMMRVGVLIALLVLGRRATLAKRASKPPTRRGRRS